MSLDYRPPAVTISEEVSPQISTSLATPAVPCLVGIAQGYQTRTDQFVLSGTAAIPLPGLPANSTVSAVTSVIDAFDPSKGASDQSGYVLTTDFTVATSAGTITRKADGAIADGTVVNVTYNYVPDDYYEAVQLSDFASIEQRFGPALKEDGTGIYSPVSYAASLALENGAGSIVIAPLFKLASASDPDSKRAQPNATEAAAASTWEQTLFALRAREDVNLITPVVGQSDPNMGDSTQLAIFQKVQDHIRFMQLENQYIIGVFGEDRSASNSVATITTIQSHATTLRSRYGGLTAQQTVLISPAKFSKALPTSGTSIVIGGQYAAAAYMGAVASRTISAAMTRQAVSGLTGILDPRKLSDKNADAAHGLTVLEQKGGNIIVRHAITLDNSSSATQELSVVRAKHRMIESIRDTVDSQIIGKLIADANAVPTVEATITSILSDLRAQKDIVDFANVSARLLYLDPTTIEVKFSYRPAFPINYVNVSFSIDLTAGVVTATTTTA